MKKLLLLFPVLVFCFTVKAQRSKVDSIFIVSNYSKIEKMIPMRDGIALYTAIYVPNSTARQHPILIKRTPYSCAPYGKSFTKDWYTYHTKYYREQYIIVYQNVRGRYMSQGAFEDVRPFNPAKAPHETDEASDTYDTIDWLVKNIDNNNGHVGIFGISYPGFYSTMAALSHHPALKAVSPQAPVTNWFIGDDFHHKGAFMLEDAFEFFSGFGVPRPAPTASYNPGYQIKEKNKYKFFLHAGPVSGYNQQFLGDSIRFWNDLMANPVYNHFWQSRNAAKHVSGIMPAVLVVGGLFDAEDLFGSWDLYKTIEGNNPASHFNKIIMGPWFHGTWEGRGVGNSLGKVKFGSRTSAFYQDSLEFPFFQYFLNGIGKEAPLNEATIFFTGENHWKTFGQWPPADIKQQALYLQPGKMLSFNQPTGAAADSFTAYTSDPMHPVPHEGGLIEARTREYMAADQRFAHKRKDVIAFSTPPLTENLLLAGPVIANLFASIGSTDADFVVKLIDVFPPAISKTLEGPDTLYRKNRSMNNYEMLVRGEIMRGKFRNSFENPEPFVPGKPAKVSFELPDVAHTFLKGHRIMVQVQSSWFPLADRNPQTFTDIYKATQADFTPATIKIYHSAENCSHLLLPIAAQETTLRCCE